MSTNRNLITLATKLNVIKDYENGSTAKMLRDKYSIKLATIYHIVTKQRDKLNSQKFAGGSVIVSGLRDPKMEKMENMLQEWIELRTGVGHPPPVQ